LHWRQRRQRVAIRSEEVSREKTGRRYGLTLTLIIYVVIHTELTRRKGLESTQYAIRIRVAAPQEYVNTYSTCRGGTHATIFNPFDGEGTGLTLHI